MPKFVIPVAIEINGSITVEASTKEEAIVLAMEEYDRRYEANMNDQTFCSLALRVMDGPDIEVDFARGDDPEAVEEDDDCDDREQNA